ncbi:LysM peptidoglycan-binding domain-containing protein [Brevibacterium spongiae]|uniref:LysM peptidoglycan-binding domain-containing protein n=1 Tax=Brevibacterium spongiae TaxID=2909672 RepID=A0ABY5SS98_9MICO|nr:LysM domain-containing protein [Brevibacterium spongiae]UVI37438.1 LysM peptidoglycan-binding domain-containing protein [Brevibacterium spongiae]
MYLLIACAGSWLVLLGSFGAAWAQLPQPWTTSDLVVIAVIGTAVLAFSRLGLVSLLALLLRLLPSGRLRSRLAGCVLRVTPRLLASSVLAVASTGVALQAVHAVPVSDVDGTTAAHSEVLRPVAVAPADPGWPTLEDDAPSGSGLPDPAWPTEPPPGEPPPEDASDPPKHDQREPDDDHAGAPENPDSAESHPDPAVPPNTVHVVEDGESLWSIAASLAESPDDTPQLVDEVYTANREIIGPDPSLIIAGQRLEIQP